MSRWKVLSTKTLDRSLVDQINTEDFDVEEKEFIDIKPIIPKSAEELFQWFDKGTADIVVTSHNAVEVLNRYMHLGDTYYVIPWRFHCLNGATKEAIRANESLLGNNIITSESNATKLAEKIVGNGIKNIIFFCGNKRRDELPSILKRNGVTVHEIIAYETIETPVITTGNFDAILFFSPSAVRSFFSVNSIDKRTVCFAIGNTTGESIGDFTDNKVIISEEPTQSMMLSTVQFYFQNINYYE